MLDTTAVQDTTKTEEGFKFTTVDSVAITSVKDQHLSGTCWDFATIGFVESEILRKTGKTYDIERASQAKLSNDATKVIFKIAPKFQETRKARIEGLRVYLQGNNLLCWSRFKLWDPELSSSYGNVYPLTRNVSLGLNLNF